MIVTYGAAGPILKGKGFALSVTKQGPLALAVNTVRTYVLSPPDLPKGEGGESTSVSGGARSPTPPRATTDGEKPRRLLPWNATALILPP